MSLIYPDDIQHSRPLRLGPDTAPDGPRIGGRAPDAIALTDLDDTFEYFATLPLSDDGATEVSLFISQDVERWFAAGGKPLEVGAGQVVRVSVHPRSVRGKAATYRSRIVDQRLHLDPEEQDWRLDPNEVDYETERPPRTVYNATNKVGGRPHLLHFIVPTLRWFEGLRSQGYLQVVQFDMFNMGPFEKLKRKEHWEPGNGWFHLFGKPPFVDTTWYWLWEF
jgi:hypothetical protein